MKIVRSFVWRKFSSVGREGWYEKMKDGQKLKLGDAPVVTPRNIQEVQASKLGDAQGIPTSSTKAPGHFSMRYIFIASCIMCYSWSVFIFCCVFLFFNKVGPHHPLFWRETRSTCLALCFLLFIIYESSFRISWLVLGVEKIFVCFVMQTEACLDCVIDFSMSC